MALLYYGVAGEGRGHAARARALIEPLRRSHRVVVYASGHALEMLAPAYARSDVEVRRLPRLEFHYGADRRVDYVRTGLGNTPWLLGMRALVKEIAERMAREGADVVLSDFEPALPRAAALAGIPVISVDHQQFLTSCDLRALPAEMRAYAAFMAPFVRLFCRGQRESIVSSFFEAPLRRDAGRVTQVGVLMRPEVRDARPERKAHLVAYLRRDSARAALRALEHCGWPVHVYGIGAGGRRGRIELRGTHPTRFVEDLASARALITTAGNQLVGEAIWLGKPVLALPEPGNFEQRINAWFVERAGIGRRCELERLDARTVRAFVADEGTFDDALRAHRRDGTAPTLARINHWTGGSAAYAEELSCDALSRSSVTSLGAAPASPSLPAS